jgi:hypothetical protein
MAEGNITTETAEAKIQSPESILRDTASKFKKLDQEVQGLSYQNKNKERTLKLVEKARLIVDLPDRIREVLEKDKDFPVKELDNLDQYATMAKDLIDKKNNFGLDVLLTAKGSTEDNPNDLESLIDRVYPESTSSR